MSQVAPVRAAAATSPAANAGASLRNSEKVAKAPSSSKLRSCVVCRARKVRCDKLSPCSNCRRANIACVIPSNDRPPRWARRLERVANNAATSAAQASQGAEPAPAHVMEKLRNLEGLVKDLRSQLEQANTASSPAAGGGSSGVHSPRSSSYEHDQNADHQRDASPNADPRTVQKQFGRLVVKDANRSRYVSSGFWSRVNDELDGLQIDDHSLGAGDSDTSDEGASPGQLSSTNELERTPSERHAFLFRHNLNPSAVDLHKFHPLPSQIPFLLEVFSENVNTFVRIVHMPTIAKLVRDLRSSDLSSLSSAHEALMFSIYYAAVTSMEEDDIMTNFGVTKTDLNLKYRLGLEHALAKADFLNVPDLVLIQAFAIFLGLVRRHDSPRFVWMMTGLAIRMGQALGLHRDGVHFKHLTPYEVEMRRRVWWVLCVLDLRASEDQGTEVTIPRGSYDTRLPLNINDADINPEITHMPAAREGITDMSFPLVWFEMGEVSKQMMAQSAKDDAPGIEEQSRLLNEIFQMLDKRYLQYSVESGNIAYWVAVTVARLVMAKMTLFIYLPVLFSSPSEHFSDEIKDKLLVAAIEVAEYNHALNAEQACRHWRWVFQTYTHWHAVIYILIESSRRPWSPIVERAWVALHSPWLIPAQSNMDKNLRVWLPLRRLTAKSRKHRDAEIERLRSDPQAAQRLEIEDQRITIPDSPGPFSAGSNSIELLRERWRQLVALPVHGLRTAMQSEHAPYINQPEANSISAFNTGDLPPDTTNEQAYISRNEFHTNQIPPDNPSQVLPSIMTTSAPSDFPPGQTAWASNNAPPVDPNTWSQNPNFVPWLLADTDPSTDILPNVDFDAIDVNMDLDGQMDWYNWVESAKGMEWDAGPNGNLPS